MTISAEQRINQMEIDLQAIKEVLQKMSRLQVENTQAMSELTFQVSELSRSVNTFVATIASKPMNHKERSNKFDGTKRQNQFVRNKQGNGTNRAESRLVREQIDTMLSQLHTLMNYLDEPKRE